METWNGLCLTPGSYSINNTLDRKESAVKNLKKDFPELINGSLIDELIDPSPAQRADSCRVRLPAAGDRPEVGDVRRPSAPGQGSRGD